MKSSASTERLSGTNGSRIEGFDGRPIKVPAGAIAPDASQIFVGRGNRRSQRQAALLRVGKLWAKGSGVAEMLGSIGNLSGLTDA